MTNKKKWKSGDKLFTQPSVGVLEKEKNILLSVALLVTFFPNSNSRPPIQPLQPAMNDNEVV